MGTFKAGESAEAESLGDVVTDLDALSRAA
jgi:hypothetical protein